MSELPSISKELQGCHIFLPDYANKVYNNAEIRVDIITDDGPLYNQFFFKTKHGRIVKIVRGKSGTADYIATVKKSEVENILQSANKRLAFKKAYQNGGISLTPSRSTYRLQHRVAAPFTGFSIAKPHKGLDLLSFLPNFFLNLYK